MTRNFKREKNGAPALRQIRRPRTRQLQLSMIGHTQRPVIRCWLGRCWLGRCWLGRCWLGGSTRICDVQAAPPSICDAQAAPPTLPSVAALASPRLLPFPPFPFPGHPCNNPGSAKENGRVKSPCRVHEHARILRSVQLPIHSNPYSSCKNAY